MMNSVMSWSFSGADAGASAAPAVLLPLAQCATKKATKTIRRALEAATDLNILPMVAVLISGPGLRDVTERRFDRIVGSRPGQFQAEVGLHMCWFLERRQ